MHEQGFLDQPLNEFMLLKDRLWRALRVLIDVDLHVNQVSEQALAKRLCETLGFSLSQAEAEIGWYTHAPTVPMSYALGWAMINALKDRQVQKADYNIRTFHDKLLASGSISLARVIRRQFGGESLCEVMQRVLT